MMMVAKSFFLNINFGRKKTQQQVHTARSLSYNLTNHAARHVYAEKYKECLRFYEKPTVCDVFTGKYTSR